jgi:hypothetical protein
MAMSLYAFVGQAESGKTAACKILTRLFYEAGYHPKTISFAAPLKRAVAAEAGYDDWEKFKTEHPERYRSECQRIGTERRIENEDYWVDRWEEELKEFIKGDFSFPPVVLVDDVRYPNELKRIKAIGGQIVYIDAGTRLPNPDNPYRTHISEELANGYAAIWNSRKFDPTNDQWPTEINIGVDNSYGLHRLETRLKDMVEVWISPTDVVFGYDNRFLYALARDYRIAYSSLHITDIHELQASGLSDDLIYRYAPKNSSKPRRNRR